MLADRNLLYGILALQMDFITRDALVQAMNAWVLDKARPLGQILVEQRALRQDAQLLLEALVQKHLEMHDGDPRRSLASVKGLGPVCDDLQRVADPDLHASLASVPTTPPVNGIEAVHLVTGPLRAAGTGLRYRILRPHARGGLGEVFVARDEELGREVALKEIQSQHADDPESRTRFVLEAEVTGNLEHPGIVAVYGLGYYDDGRPYYAMRFIRGDSLKDAIRCFHDPEKASRDSGERAVEFRQLLGRFVAVCNAVAYAHSRGVLHRDLKPANVMLGKYGETLVVDWGLAKTVARPEGTSEITLRTGSAGIAATQMGSALGTPQFMPPEQAAGRLDLLGPPSDVYSLGATLYSLLTGKAPFERGDLGAVLQRVQRGDFLPPRQVKKEVPAALEAICLKAMALKPENRYASAQALAGEIEHWLADEPVGAYREPWTVRAGRWVRRHRTKVTAGVAAVAVATVCLTVATVLLVAANRREREANQREREAREAVSRERDEVSKQKERADRNLAKTRKAVEDFCTNVAEDERLKQGDLHALRKKLLETAVPFYEEFVQQKGDDAELRADQGWAYFRLALLRAEMGETDQAIADYRQMRMIFAGLARFHTGETRYNLGLARGHINLGLLLVGQGQDKEAEEAFRQALAAHQKLGKDFSTSSAYRSDLAKRHINLGLLQAGRGQYREAEEEYRQALAVGQKLVKDCPAVPGYRSLVAISLQDMGELLNAWGRPREAEKAIRQALGVWQKLVKDSSTIAEYREGLATSYNSLGGLLNARGRYKEAEEAFQQALVVQQKLVKDFPAVPEYRSHLARSHNNLGVLLKAQGQHKEAEKASHQALDVQQKLVKDFPTIPQYRNDVAGSHNNLGMLLEAQGQNRAAEEAYRRAVDIRQQLVKGFPTVPRYCNDLASSHDRLGSLLNAIGRYKEAEKAFRQALDLGQQLVKGFPAVPEYRSNLAYSQSNLGVFLHARGRYKEAEEAFRQALTARQKLVKDYPAAPEHRNALASNYNNLGNLLKHRGRYKEAEEAYRQGLTVWQKLVKDFPTIHQHRTSLGGSYCNLGNLVRDTGQPKVALVWYAKAIATLQADLDLDSRQTTARLFLRNAHLGRADALMKLARHAEAVKDWDRAIALADGGYRPLFRLQRAISLAHAGDHAKAVAEANSLVKGKTVQGDTLYDAACVCALASASSKDNTKLKDQYAARAVELLAKAREAGFFKDAAKVAHMKKDSDLDSLRSREDYKKLVAELEKESKGKSR